MRGREGERERGREVVILPLFNKIHVTMIMNIILICGWLIN